MATWPSYAKLAWADTAEQPAPVVQRSEMDRGVAKQRRTQADAVVTCPVTVYFNSAADAASFETWVYTTLNGGMDWFDFTSLRTGATLSMRIVGGDIGALVPSTRTWARSQRSFKIEFVRAAL